LPARDGARKVDDMRTRPFPWSLAVAGLAALSCGDDDTSPITTAVDAASETDAVRRPDAARAPDAAGPPDATPPPGPPPPGLEALCGPRAAEVEARLDALLPTLTLEQKVALMHGSTLLAADGIWPLPGLPEADVPGLRMVDGPRGVNHRLEGLGATAFPVGVARGATWDPALERRVGEAMATEARAVGAGVLLAPTVNVLRHPRWGRAQESYGEDPHHLGALGVAFVEGVQSRKVVACAKHFAANSIENTRFEVDVQVEERALHEVYTPHFRRLVDAGVGAVMSAYNKVNGAYCAENGPLLDTLLKQSWGFTGFVVSDWIFGTHSTVGSALAGLDIEMPLNKVYGAPLVQAVRAGEVDEGVIDAAVRRIVRVQWCFEHDTAPPEADGVGLESEAHRALAREAARRGLVLLKNEGAALPVDPATALRVAVLGRVADVENIGDAGSSNVRPREVVTALEGLREALPGATLTHVVGVAPTPEELDAIAAADVVFVFTGNLAADEGEALIAAGDRSSLQVPAEERALIEQVGALHPRVVVVLEGGGAFEMPWLGAVEAVVMAWYPGAEGGRALAEVLLGRAEPTGRLPVTFPAREVDLPPFDNVALTVQYDLWHGYRHLGRQGIAAIFPFGHGLAYTTFEYGDARVEPSTATAGDSVLVHVAVRNTGARVGTETVQLYVTPPETSVDRGVRTLRGFVQLEVAPGAEAQGVISLSVADLATWDPERDVWHLEPGDYRLSIARNAEDDGRTLTLSVSAR
jgi:beta-glucosidase